jgi:hypothetical protein
MAQRDARQPKQSPSTGESTKDQDKQVPARSDVAAPSDPRRPGAGEAEPAAPHQAVREKGPKSGGMGPKQ